MAFNEYLAAVKHILQTEHELKFHSADREVLERQWALNATPEQAADYYADYVNNPVNEF